MSAVRDITGAELKQFLDAKGVGFDCPACGQSGGLSISVNGYERDSDGQAPAVRIQQHLPGRPNVGFGQYVQACLNCGYLRYFRDIEVLAFLDGDSDNG